MDRLAERFVNWFEALNMQPENPDENAWLPSSYLEYQFGLAARDGVRMTGPVEIQVLLLVATLSCNWALGFAAHRSVHGRQREGIVTSRGSGQMGC